MYMGIHYCTPNNKHMFDCENPKIRLIDNDTIHEKYYVSKEAITWDMLGYIVTFCN